MARLKEAKLPAVIDEDMIYQAVIEDRTIEKEASGLGSSVEEEEKLVDFQEIDSLVLSFRDIAVIQNLQGFEKLVRLQLDNNSIDRIEGLNHLVNLEWLDLSFNKIIRIENLDGCSKLTDLSLFHNQITQIENLDGIPQLNVLSIGHNQIKSLEDIQSLRKFKNLRCLIIKENPICQDENYLSTVLAHLKSLKYLDYELISAQQVKSALDERHEELQEIEERERQEASQEVKRVEWAKRCAVADQANVLGVETLFDDMTREDLELVKLRLLPGFLEILDGYHDQFQELTRDFLSKIMGIFQAKQEESRLFNAALSQLKAACEGNSIALIESFEKQRKKAYFKTHDAHVALEAMHVLEQRLQALLDALMELEIQQTDQIAALHEEVYLALKDLAKDASTQISNYCGRLLEIEKVYFDATQRLANSLQEKNASGTDVVDSSDYKWLLDDKDVLAAAVNSSHERHEEAINALEARIAERERRYAETQDSVHRESEYTRNRQRVAELHAFAERHRLEIGERMAQLSAHTAPTLHSAPSPSAQSTAFPSEGWRERSRG